MCRNPKILASLFPPPDQIHEIKIPISYKSKVNLILYANKNGKTKDVGTR